MLLIAVEFECSNFSASHTPNTQYSKHPTPNIPHSEHPTSEHLSSQTLHVPNIPHSEQKDYNATIIVT